MDTGFCIDFCFFTKLKALNTSNKTSKKHLNVLLVTVGLAIVLAVEGEVDDPRIRRSNLVIIASRCERGGAADVCMVSILVVLVRRVIVLRLQPLEEVVAFHLVDTELRVLAADGAGYMHGIEHGPVDVNNRQVCGNHGRDSNSGRVLRLQLVLH